jgi:hypothetical protein
MEVYVVERSGSYVSSPASSFLSPDDYTGYTLFDSDNSSPYAQFYRQSGNSSR